MIIFKEKADSKKDVEGLLHPIVKQWFFSRFQEFSLPQLYGVTEVHKRNNILVSASTGSGKCLTPDENVLIEENGFTRLITGNELIEKTTQRIKKIGPNGALWKVPTLKSYSLLDNKHLQNVPAFVYFESGKYELLNIQTEYGRGVKVSQDHPIFVEGIGWTKAKDLKKGMKIASFKKISLPEKTISLNFDLSILELKKKNIVSATYKDYIFLKQKTKTFTYFEHLSPEELKQVLLLENFCYSDVGKILNIGISSVHKIIHKKSSWKEEEFFQLIIEKRKNIENTFQANEIRYMRRGIGPSRFFFPKILNKDLAAWVAFILAEGLIGKYQKGSRIMISQSVRTELLEKFFQTTEKYFGITFLRKNLKDYTFDCTTFADFITTLFSLQKGIGRYVEFPYWLLNCNRKIKRHFLYVFFSLEAHISTNGIQLSQANKKKIEVLNYILLSEGIICSLREHYNSATNTIQKIKRPYWQITIYQKENLKKFLNYIDISHHKREHLIKLINSHYESGHGVGKYKLDYKEIRKLSKYFQNDKEFNQCLGTIYNVVRRTGYITTPALKRLQKKIKTLNPEHPLLEYISSILQEHFLWLKIKKIEPFVYEGKIFDLHVPGLHNFIGGSGALLLHNTLTSFLAILNELVDCAEKGILQDKIYTVYISPLKALNRDVSLNLLEPLEEMEKLSGKSLGIRVAVRTGDTTANEKQKMLKTCPHVLITTPESLALLLSSTKFAEHLKHVDWSIIDECLPYETLITMSNGQKVKIGSLVEKKLKNEELVSKLNDEIFVKSINERGEMHLRKILKVHKIKNTKPLLRIHTKNSFATLKMTGNHPIAILQDNKIHWKEAKDLKIDDSILFHYSEIPKEKTYSTKEKTLISEKQFRKAYLELLPIKSKYGNSKLKKLEYSIQKLKELKLLPLTTQSQKLPILSKLSGHLFGDGWLTLTQKCCNLGFSGDVEDLNTITRDIKYLGFKCQKVSTRKTHSKAGETMINGTSNQMCLYSKPLVILFSLLGVPIGDKTITSYEIPRWLRKSNLTLKREFLSSFLGSEGMKPIPDKNKQTNFNAPRIPQNKEEKILDSGLLFAKQIQDILKEFNIHSSPLIVTKGNLRKNGTITKKIVITISNNEENLHRLYSYIGFRYCKRKEALAKQASIYIYAKFLARKNRQKLIKDIVKFKKNGKNYKEISLKLGLQFYGGRNYGTNILKLVDWLRRPCNHKRHLYHFPSFKEFSKSYIFGDCYIDKVTQIYLDESPNYVYDLTIDKAHNFLANDIVVHNCHAIADSKRGVHLSLSLERLQRLSPGMCRIGLSATVAPLFEVAQYLVGTERNCTIIDVQSMKKYELELMSPVEDFVNETYTNIEKKTYELLDTLIHEHKTTLIFTNTRAATERVVHHLKEKFPHKYESLDEETKEKSDLIGAHHGSLSKEHRLKMENNLREGKMKAICCSTSLELGIDIGYIDLVVCLGSPKSVARLLQRCLPYNAKILLDDGTYKEIGEIVENKLNVSILSYDPKNKKIVKSKIAEYHKNQNLDLLKIRLHSGSEISCTEEHPLLTKEGWKKAADIHRGDFVGELFDYEIGKTPYLYEMLPQKDFYVENKEDFLRAVVDRYVKENRVSYSSIAKKIEISQNHLQNYLRRNGRRKSIRLDIFLRIMEICHVSQLDYLPFLQELKSQGHHRLPLPLYPTKDLLWLAGLVASDGALTKTKNPKDLKIKIGNKDKKLLEECKRIYFSLGFYPKIRYDPESHFYTLDCGAKIIVYFLASLGIKIGKGKSFEIKVSNILNSLPKELAIPFIEGLLEGDGNKNANIRIFSASKEFILGIHNLLNRFGIQNYFIREEAKKSRLVQKINSDKIYCLYIGRSKYVKEFLKYCTLYGKKAQYLQNKNFHHQLQDTDIEDNVSWTEVCSIEKINSESFVYNITLEKEPNTYIVDSIITHNCGRAGHKLHDMVKARVLVQDRDDLVECAVMLKFAKEKKMDRIDIPTNCLDVLAQQIFGMALEDVWDVKEMYTVVKRSYCYRDLSTKDFEEVLDYLAGNFISLEERYIYARIWWNKEEGKVGKKGRMSRVIYMTNIGTIPDQQGVIVKDQRGNKIGMIDEAFLEKLDKGDIFVLGGNTYQFTFARGMVAQVIAMPGKKPTVPSWYSDRLPLSYDLANGIGNFRELIENQFKKKKDKKEVLHFIHEYLYVDKVAAEALYNYCKDQYDYIGMPSSKKILIEHYRDEHMKNYVVFHALYGRRVNDVLSRAVAYAISRAQHKDVELGISDNGFYISYDRNVNVSKAFSLVKSKELRKILELAVDKSEILKRRFRHCAGRALMILRTYGGIKRRVGKQQVSSMILLNAVRRISDNFFILRETRREVLEDLMDYDSALEVLQKIEEGKIKIEEIHTFIPSPFALNLVMQGYSDILRLEDKQQFLQRMHQMVKAKIALKNR